MRYDALVLVLCLLDGCRRGESNPTAPLVLLPDHTLTLLSARTGQQIADAVVSAGQTLVTDSVGVAHMPGEAIGRVVTVLAAGYIQPTRFIYLANMTYWLIPDDKELPYEHTAQAFYGSEMVAPLSRPIAGVMFVIPSYEFRSGRRWDALAFAVDLHNNANARISSGRPYMPVPPRMIIAEEWQTSAPTGAMEIRVYEDGSDPIWSEPGYENAGVVAYATLKNYVFTAGRIVFKDTDAFFKDHLRKAMAHELTHQRGYSGHPPGPIMGSSEPNLQFGSRELETLRNLLFRVPGTVARDDSSMAPTLLTGAGMSHDRERIICVLPR